MSKKSYHSEARYNIVVHSSPEEERLAYIYNLLYPAWKTVLFSWVVSVILTVFITWLLLEDDELTNYTVGLTIASICSISISYSVSRISDAYQAIIREKNETLLNYAGDLTRANKELEAFARTVAHDIKSPISNMVGYSALLLEEGAHFSDAETREMLERILNQGEQTARIIDEILLLAKARHEDIDLGPVDMQETVQNALSRLTELVSEKNATIEYPEQWPRAIGYAPWVEEIWVNYISNALKYGGEPPKLTLGASFEGGEVRFWVEDNGIGLTREQQSLLFVEFSRLHEEDYSDGHGLGLSIVQRIGRRLGGDVGVESTVGVGSRFYFTLPENMPA